MPPDSGNSSVKDMIAKASEQIKKQAIERKEAEQREKDMVFGMMGPSGTKASRTIQPKKAFLLGVPPDESSEEEAGFDDIDGEQMHPNQEMLDIVDGVGPAALKNQKNKQRTSSFDLDSAF